MLMRYMPEEDYKRLRFPLCAGKLSGGCIVIGDKRVLRILILTGDARWFGEYDTYEIACDLMKNTEKEWDKRIMMK